MKSNFLTKENVSKFIFGAVLVFVFSFAFGPAIYAESKPKVEKVVAKVLAQNKKLEEQRKKEAEETAKAQAIVSLAGYGYGYGYGYGTNGKVSICHATGSKKKPYNLISVNVASLKGHLKHTRDIVPAPAGGCPIPNGGAIKGQGAQVYFYENGVLRPFTSMRALRSKGHSASTIIVVPNDQLKNFQIGQPL